MTNDKTTASIETLSPDALRQKYREERDRRLRGDGTRQYIDMTGAFSDYGRDPYVESDIARDAINDEADVVILGGGFSGLMAGANLRKQGVEDIRIIEQGGDFGGTWYWNRYPGIRCDIESYIYLPLLEEVGTIPSEKYAQGAEIFAHCQAIGRRFDLYRGALFQTSVTRISWDEASGRWHVETSRGDMLKAKFVIAGNGFLHRPKLPGIPGLQDFKGRAFHTSRWDYDYTGGNAGGNLTGLRDKRVALIGTGATTIQVVPEVARWAKQLYVFQRTPSVIDTRDNRPTDPEWFHSQEPGWQIRRRDNFLSFLLGIPQDEDLIKDQWTSVAGKIYGQRRADQAHMTDEERGAMIQALDDEHMARMRARIDTIITDPATAEAMKPWYNFFCKRPLFSDEYLQSFNQDNVSLIDTSGRGVERITEDSVIVDGEAYPVDCIIFATGFRAAAYPYDSGGYEMIGRDGITLEQKWSMGVRTLHGMLMSGFPNLFVIGSPHQAGGSVNYTHIVQEQSQHIAELIGRCIREDIDLFEISEQAETDWFNEVEDRRIDRSKFEQECTPSYFNNEGAKEGDGRRSLFGSTYGGGLFRYIDLCKAWRKNIPAEHLVHG